MTPSALAAHFETSRQAVSKHIRILAECGILGPERQGREIQYHLKADKMREIETWLAQFKAVMSQRFTQLDDVLARLKTQTNPTRRGTP